MHILISDFVHVNASQIILNGLNCVWSIFLVWVFFSQVLQNYLVLNIVFGEAKLLNFKTWNVELPWHLLSPVHIQWIGFRELMSYGSVSINHHSDAKLFYDFRRSCRNLDFLSLFWGCLEGSFRVFALFHQFKVSIKGRWNRGFVLKPFSVHGFDICDISCRQKVVLELWEFRKPAWLKIG